jgi:SEC-C motif-containing protein
MARKSKPGQGPKPAKAGPVVPAASAACPCGSGKSYAECCRPLHTGEARATTAEQLMRSRFSAFAVGDGAYLLRSWHSSTRPARLNLDPATRWTRLEILSTSDGGPFHAEGTVEFRAYYRERSGPEESMRENSTFARENGAWVYVSAL